MPNILDEDGAPSPEFQKSMNDMGFEIMRRDDADRLRAQVERCRLLHERWRTRPPKSLFIDSVKVQRCRFGRNVDCSARCDPTFCAPPTK